MPEITELKDLPSEFFRLVETGLIQHRLEKHLNGPFKGAELNSMKVAELLLLERNMDKRAISLVKLGILLTDLGKMGGIRADEQSGVNQLLESIYELKDHGLNPQTTSVAGFVETVRTRLEPLFQSRFQGSLDVALQNFYKLYGFNEGTTLRQVYNQHVIDSLEVLDTAWQQVADPNLEQDYAKVRKTVALHHAYRFIPEGYTVDNIEEADLIAMAADVYDATITRPPIDGFVGNDHITTMKMLNRNFAMLPETLKPNADSVINSLEAQKDNIAEFYKPPVVIPSNPSLQYFAGVPAESERPSA